MVRPLLFTHQQHLARYEECGAFRGKNRRAEVCSRQDTGSQAGLDSAMHAGSVHSLRFSRNLQMVLCVRDSPGQGDAYKALSLMDLWTGSMSGFTDDERRKMQALIFQGLLHCDGEETPRPSLPAWGGSSKARWAVLRRLERAGPGRGGRHPLPTGHPEADPSLPGTCGDWGRADPQSPSLRGKGKNSHRWTHCPSQIATGNYRGCLSWQSRAGLCGSSVLASRGRLWYLGQEHTESAWDWCL